MANHIGRQALIQSDQDMSAHLANSIANVSGAAHAVAQFDRDGTHVILVREVAGTVPNVGVLRTVRRFGRARHSLAGGM